MASQKKIDCRLSGYSTICLCLCFFLQGLVSANVELVSSRFEINQRCRDLKKDCEAKDLRIAELEAARKKDEGRVNHLRLQLYFRLMLPSII